MYDIYRHVDQTDLRLTVPRGAGLPKKASVGKWRLLANRKVVPRLVSEEIIRIGYCVTRPKADRQ